MIIFFYVYTVAAHLNLRIYPLIDRVTYYVNFQAYVINEAVDHVILGSLLVAWLYFSIERQRPRYISIGVAGLAVAAGGGLVAIFQTSESGLLLDAIALMSLPVASALMLFNKYSSKKILKNQHYELVLRYGAIVGIITGFITLAYSIIPITGGTEPDSTPVRSYAHDVFLIVSSVAPALIILLIACVPTKIIINAIARAVPGTKGVQTGEQSESEKLSLGSISKSRRAILLSLIIALSIVIVIIPHLATINPDSQQVGVDTGFYVTWVGALDNTSDAGEFFNEAFVVQRGGDRPVSLLFIFAVWKAASSLAGTADLFLVVEFLPLLLAPALALSVYFLARELTRNDSVAIVAAFLTVVSYHTLIGVYAGFYANWLALVFGYVSFLFLFRYLKDGRIVNAALFTGLMMLTLFTHVYTWSILALASGVFLAVAIAKNYSNTRDGVRRYAIVLLAGLLATVAADIAKTMLTGSSGGIEEDIELAGSLAGPEQFVLRWNNLTYTATTFVGGIFANFIILGLALYWLVRNRMREMAAGFLMVFFSVGLLPFLFGEWVIQTRVFYNIPFQIPAAIALFWITRRSKTMLVPAAIFLWLIAVSLLVAANFYFVSPEPLTQEG